MTLYLQRGLWIPPLQGGTVVVPPALIFMLASRQSAARARHRGTIVLIEGCFLQIAGLAALVLTLAIVSTPTASMLAQVSTIFGYGQGLVRAPLSSVVLSTVKPASAGSGAVPYGTTAQIANARPESRSSARCSLRSMPYPAPRRVVRGDGHVRHVDYDSRRISVLDATVD